MEYFPALVADDEKQITYRNRNRYKVMVRTKKSSGFFRRGYKNPFFILYMPIVKLHDPAMKFPQIQTYAVSFSL